VTVLVRATATVVATFIALPDRHCADSRATVSSLYVSRLLAWCFGLAYLGMEGAENWRRACHTDTSISRRVIGVFLSWGDVIVYSHCRTAYASPPVGLAHAIPSRITLETMKEFARCHYCPSYSQVSASRPPAPPRKGP